jgi:hypothetical protein
MPVEDVPVRSVITPAHVAHTVNPVSRIGPVVTRGATTRGLRARSCVWICSKTSAPIMAGTAILTTSSSGLRWRVRDEVTLNRHSPI